jgi:hypothetical protein
MTFSSRGGGAYDISLDDYGIFMGYLWDDYGMFFDDYGMFL